MKIARTTGLLVVALAMISASGAWAQFVTLTGNSYTNTFDNLEAEMAPPSGWYLYTGANATSAGSLAAFGIASYTSWSNAWWSTSGRFANYASTFSYLGGTNFIGGATGFPMESLQIQTNEPNRALGIRQTSSFGDPGAAFVIKINDTLNRKDFALQVDFLNLATNAARVTTWTIDYGFGLTPSAFVPLTNYVSVPTNIFRTTRTNILIPNGTIDNNAGPVWIRIVALTSSVGSGSREATAIDNFGLTWAEGVACTPVSISSSPASIPGAYVGQNVSFTVGVSGTEPKSYVWIKNGTTVLTDDGHFSGTTTPILSISSVTTGDSGTYACTVSNVCDGTVYSQTSGSATLTVSTPPEVSVAYLRSLVDPVSFVPTNTSLLYKTTGIITTATNLTSGNTASYYLQDGTAGINLFVTFGSTFRPIMGDVVTAVGFLSSFSGNLELEADLSNAAQSVNILSNNIAGYPVAEILSWDGLATNNNPTAEYNLEGKLAILTDVYFGTNAGWLTFATNYSFYVTNSAGKAARVYFYASQNNDLTNRTIPAYAYAVQGPVIQVTNSTPPAGTPGVGYQINVTRWVDILTSPLSVAVTRSGNSATINWTAIPLTYSYTVSAATDVAGPYSPIATGLKFSDANGTYTDTGAGGILKFYRVTSP